MTFRKLKLELSQVKEIDIVSYLSSIGHEPKIIRGVNFWYLSPLRKETQASFKVNRTLNRWYDFGLGEGGSIIDFAMRYNQFTFGQFLHSLLESPHYTRAVEPKLDRDFENPIKILESRPLGHDALLNYLQGRRISLNIADQYLKELHFEINKKIYFGLGFPNKSGGYEIRNSFMKLSTSPKDISVLIHNNQKAAIFEGFMDFLTFRTLNPDLDESKLDYIILNSVSLFHRTQSLLDLHQNVALYFDNDQAGRSLTQTVLSSGEKYTDESSLYNNYKDLNEWACSIGQSKKISHGSLRIK